MTKKQSGEDFFKDPEAARNRKIADLKAELETITKARISYRKMNDEQWAARLPVVPPGWTRTGMIEQFQRQEETLEKLIASLEQNGVQKNGAR